MKKIFLIFVISMFFLTLILASAPTLGTFKINEEVELKQSCFINGSICESCNLSSVTYPNSTKIIESKTLTKANSEFNYTLNGGLINVIGDYKVNGFCSYEDIAKPFVYSFQVTNTGTIPSTAEGIIYVIGAGFIFILFLISLYVTVTLPMGNKRNQIGEIIGVGFSKYFKLFAGIITYLLFLFLLVIGKSLSSNFLFLNETYQFFNVTFLIFLVAFAPLLICFIGLAIIYTIGDKKVLRGLARGIRQR